MSGSAEAIARALEAHRRLGAVLARGGEAQAQLVAVLGVLREVFDADRTWLLYPCDPQAPAWWVPVEVTVPEYPGAFAAGEEVPMDATGRAVFARVLAAPGPVVFSPMPAGSDWVVRYRIRAQMLTVVRPRYGAPWLLGLHQCREVRSWSAEEQALFAELAGRIADLLSLVRMGEDLRRREARLQLALEAAGEAHWEWDLDAREGYLSPRFVGLYGDPAAGLRGWLRRVHRDDRRAVVTALRAHLAGASPGIDVEYRFRGAQGWRWLHTRGRLVSLPGAAPGRVLAGTHADVTARKEAELALRAEKERAARAERAKSRYLAAASHDLRQPLHALHLLLQALERRSAAPEVGEIAAEMRASLAAMQQLLDTVLEVARLEAGAVRVRREDLPLEPFLEALQMRLAPAAAARGVALHLHLVPAVLDTDPVLLGSILQNLLANAVRHARRRVMLAARWGRTHVRLEVRDDGPGIPRAERGRIFEEFYRGRGAERGPGAGLGLGLAIARRSADLLGLAIRLRSAEGRGSAFAIAVPRAQPARPAAPPPRVHGGGRLALVADPDPVQAQALGRLLEVWDFRVIVATGGAEAVAAAGWEPPLLVVSAARLADGWDAEALLTRLAAQGPLKAVVLGDEGGAPGPDRCLLPRPPEPAQLAEALARLLGERG
ncbi:PAS domain-containing sensor histidine kinase [Inmirania thermothiophila]|uniref:histidine kinase n=1 Tax=Inmirania thermothiophila TaxID=1750597 RepID=A0A3N1Y698_9GAMM|nr:HAMP domain-containing sensor histidine kinase [Inmirania thermothiophila]ROR34346.1 signal transduction histidine kinase [Inmirania thermothiophila]